MSALETAFRARFGRAPFRHEVEEMQSHVAMSWGDLGWLTRMWREDLYMHAWSKDACRMLHRSLAMIRISKFVKGFV